MHVPVSIADSITDRLNAVTNREISPFEVKSLQRDIEQLRSVDAAQAYMLGGMLSSLVGDDTSSVEQHEKSLRLSAGVVEYMNYGISMRRLGFIRKSLELFLRAFDYEPNSESILSHVVNSMVFAGDYSRLDFVVDKFDRSHSVGAAESLREVVTALSIRSHVVSLEIPFQEFERFHSYIEQVLREFRISPKQIHERLSSFDGVPHIYVEIRGLQLSAKELLAANDRIAELVLGSDEISAWDKIVINFTSCVEGAVDAA